MGKTVLEKQTEDRLINIRVRFMFASKEVKAFAGQILTSEEGKKVFMEGMEQARKEEAEANTEAISKMQSLLDVLEYATGIKEAKPEAAFSQIQNEYGWKVPENLEEKRFAQERGLKSVEVKFPQSNQGDFTSYCKACVEPYVNAAFGGLEERNIFLNRAGRILIDGKQIEIKTPIIRQDARNAEIYEKIAVAMAMGKKVTFLTNDLANGKLSTAAVTIHGKMEESVKAYLLEEGSKKQLLGGGKSPSPKEIEKAEKELLRQLLVSEEIVNTPVYKKQMQINYEQNLLQAQMCKDIFGEDAADMPLFGDSAIRNNTKYEEQGPYRLKRVGLALGVAVLLSGGMSFEDILNPEVGLEKKRAAGNYVKELVAKGEAGKSEMAFMAEDAMRILAEKDYAKLSGNQLEDLGNAKMVFAAGIAFDLNQETCDSILSLKQAHVDRLRKENETENRGWTEEEINEKAEAAYNRAMQYVNPYEPLKLFMYIGQKIESLSPDTWALNYMAHIDTMKEQTERYNDRSVYGVDVQSDEIGLLRFRPSEGVMRYRQAADKLGKTPGELLLDCGYLQDPSINPAEVVKQELDSLVSEKEIAQKANVLLDKAKESVEAKTGVDYHTAYERTTRERLYALEMKLSHTDTELANSIRELMQSDKFLHELRNQETRDVQLECCQEALANCEKDSYEYGYLSERAAFAKSESLLVALEYLTGIADRVPEEETVNRLMSVTENKIGRDEVERAKFDHHQNERKVSYLNEHAEELASLKQALEKADPFYLHGSSEFKEMKKSLEDIIKHYEECDRSKPKSISDEWYTRLEEKYQNLEAASRSYLDIKKDVYPKEGSNAYRRLMIASAIHGFGEKKHETIKESNLYYKNVLDERKAVTEKEKAAVKELYTFNYRNRTEDVISRIKNNLADIVLSYFVNKELEDGKKVSAQCKETVRTKILNTDIVDKLANELTNMTVGELVINKKEELSKAVMEEIKTVESERNKEPVPKNPEKVFDEVKINLY